jgi:DNA-directed RNA polymerase specialized sigma24 family protein
METDGMANSDYAWLRYAELQQRSRKAQNFNGYTWGLESALNFLLNAVETDTIPSNPADLDAALNRVIASGARLCRSRSATLKKWVLPSELTSTHTAAEANIELARIEGAVKETDGKILLDAGLGYTDREIADRYASTPGAVRARLSRLRLKLSAGRRSESDSAARHKAAHPVYAVPKFDPQPMNQAA